VALSCHSTLDDISLNLEHKGWASSHVPLKTRLSSLGLSEVKPAVGGWVLKYIPGPKQASKVIPISLYLQLNFTLFVCKHRELS